MSAVVEADGKVTVSPLFERFMYGLVLADPEGRVLHLNRKARQLLLPPERQENGHLTCCDLICGRLGPMVDGGCLTDRALASKAELSEVRMDVGRGRLATAAWVTASSLEAESHRVVFHLRPGRTGDRRRRIAPGWDGASSSRHGCDLQISTLGRFEIEGPDGPINGEWLEQRPGQLLKYLTCERRRVVSSDQAAEALWPEAGLDEGKSRLRYNVHALREKLEPDREYRSPARFVVARRNGYMFDTGRVWVDVDEFEREASAGLAAHKRSLSEQAAHHLDNAMRLYRGDFLAEDPYEEWVLGERERLRELAAQTLRTHARIDLDLGRLEPAAEHTRRLAELEPFDADVHRLLIEICLRRGRWSEAHRRYARFRRRIRDVFATEPAFDLSDVKRQIGAAAVDSSSAAA